MRKIVFIAALFFYTSSCCQQLQKAVQRCASIGISKGYSSFWGDNFIAKSYNPNSPFCLDFQIRIYKNIGIGGYMKHSVSSLKTDKYVGTSSNGNFSSFAAYLCYLVKLNKKWLLVPKITVGSFVLENVLKNATNPDGDDYTYTSNGTAYSVSTDFNYFISNHFSLYTNAEYSYVDMSGINASPVIGTSYKKTNQFSLQFGIKLWIIRR